MRILIADDDVTSRLELTAMASRLGHECLVANDGSTAWELLSSERIDVLLTDWMMPGLNGPELCRRVRDDLRSRYVYIVLITVLDQCVQVLEGMGAGADDYLVKPIDPFALQTRLVAASRVTAVHRQLVDSQAQLKRANRRAVEPVAHRHPDRPRQSPPDGGRHDAGPRSGAPNRPDLRHRASRHRPLQALQRPLRPSGRRRGPAPGRTVPPSRFPGRREHLPLRRRGVPGASARLWRRRCRCHGRTDPEGGYRNGHTARGSPYVALGGDPERWGHALVAGFGPLGSRSAASGGRSPVQGQVGRTRLRPRGLTTVSCRAFVDVRAR